ncbi:hypothetical protein HETIRDRAFT_387618 [Heterobasidion irregulare TC 32-1]|uniref:Deacetylase sirtuin-type domain-containing protein n=1 Tax=Heterobasidion irregulare (strain TC 32-1) TaxID=747525 RepID=W4K0R4_HETIT|nr:uncharacterized protein HETIRDRAFT_387618 [Heterobasidion irregulare TC 32-1]ETW79289.1 hypothetical protein HETIRDRAFT_387618 [Heterobasidion irregulare TC 32-1]
MLHHLKEKGMSSFIMEYVVMRAIPVFQLLVAFGILLCDELQSKQPATLLYFLRVALSRELQMREKVPQYNTIDDAVNLIKVSKRILILTGAGISVSCGIPDFRSENGLYANLKDRGEYELDDPQQMFDIQYFKENPSVFFSFAKQIYPSNFTPSPCHRFIKLIEDKGKLLRNYTQNIDTLETLAGVRNVLQCHGSFATASCLHCRMRMPGSEIETEIMNGEVPQCKQCSNLSSAQKKPERSRKRKGGKRHDYEDDSDEEQSGFPPWIIKPDITFFGEKLTDAFDDALHVDRGEVDLILVIGTSLKVSPVSEILTNMPHSVPQILINKTPVKHINPDIILLGNADPIIQYICDCLQWTLPPVTQRNDAVVPDTVHVRSFLQPAITPSNDRKRPLEDPSILAPQPQRVGNSHIWLFEGAEGGKWLETRQAEEAERKPQESLPWSPTESPSTTTSPPADVPREAKKPRVA